MNKKPPVVSRSLPLLGHFLEFQKDRQALLKRGYEEKGPIFSIRLAHKKAVVFADAELAGLFYKETDKKLNMAKPYNFIRKSIGDISLFMDHETYLNQRPMLLSPFSREKMSTYLEVFNYTVQLWLDQLGSEGTIEIAYEMARLAQEVAGRCIMGHETHESIGKEFWENFYTIGRALDPMLPPSLPLPKNFRRNKAKKEIERILDPILKERRTHPERYNDVLQDILNTPYADGTRANDYQVLCQVIGLLFAGHETTAGQAAWSVIQLLQHPEYCLLVTSELKEKFPYGAKIDARSLTKLSHLKWALDETTRLRPSADIIMRVTDEEIEVMGYTIPRNWYVILGTGVLQRRPDYFSNPNEYDPLRFSPERAEQKTARNSISGFGGGMHKCTGMNFALNEMATIVGLLFQQFELELVTKEPKQISNLGTSHPEKTYIKYKRRDLSTLVEPNVVQEAIEAGCPHIKMLANRESA